MAALTLTELINVLNDCNGYADPVEPSDDLADVTFDELGFDSLTRLNAVLQLERTHGIKLPEDVVSEAKTPGQLLDLINTQLA
ncbi:MULTISPECIES: acyl carrier protein [Streptomyces]|uniref:acyl carrier protein n=1 Tax=Streptomyces TaxID=1883 RepID=UPI000A3795DA|nr:MULTISPECIES: acyl carrier protein [Streptomyces]MDN5385464.1 acyl carrier protein [Streptomyces sp. LB8]MDN5385467.1 acyl carrier protein [Streptomyces sp. LB8]